MVGEGRRERTVTGHHMLVVTGGPAARDPGPLPLHDLVIAADSGAEHAPALGLTADVLVGDMDSVDPTLLADLEKRATTPGNVYRHRWRPGDVLIWDNRCTMHRRDDFDPATRRIMHRSQIRGTRMNAAA